VRRLCLAGAIPFAGLGLQLLFWPEVQPFCWLFFYPAVFFSSWISGFRGGVIATLLSIFLVWCFFLAPQHSFALGDSKVFYSMGIFVFMGILFSFVNERLRRANQQMAEDRFRTMFEQAAIGIAQVGLDGRWLRANQRVCDILGYTDDELRRRTFQDLTHPEDLEADLSQVKSLLAGEIESYTLEKRYLRKDGTTVPVNLTVSLVHDFAGRPDHLVSVIEDITQRRQAEDSLRESERKFYQLFHSTPVAGSLTTIEEGRYLDVNEAFLKLFGRSRDEVIGKTALDLNVWVDLNRRAELFSKLKQDGEVRHFEMAMRSRNGQIFELLWSGNRVRIGAQDCLLGSGLDITERKQAEVALRASEERLRFVTENARVGLVVLNSERRYLFANSEYCDIFGLPAGIVGLRIAEVLPSVYAEQIQPRLDRAFGGERVAYELRQPRKGGTRYFAVTYEPVGHAQAIRQVVAVTIDITDRVQAERSLLEREAQLRLFAAHSPAAIAMLDREMKYVVVSQRWLDDYGMRGQSVIGKSHYEVFPEITESWREIHQRCLAGASEKRDEEAFIRADGTTNWIRWEIQPWRGADGRVGGIIIFSEDISARKAAEAAKNLFRALVERSSDAIYIVDPQTGRFLDFNESACQSLGYSRNELLRLTVTEMAPEIDRAVFDASIEFLDRNGPMTRESIHRRKDGSTFPVEVSLSLVTLDRKYLLAITRDVSLRKQTEDLLEFVAQEGWHSQPEDFLPQLVNHIGSSLGMDYVLIGKCLDGGKVRTNGLYAKGRLVNDIEYETRGAPCPNVAGKSLCQQADKLQELFPNDKLLAEMGVQSFLGIPLTDSAGKALGILAVLDGKPMPDSKPATALLQIAAVRASGEIERRIKVEELQWKTAFLEALVHSSIDGMVVVDNAQRRVFQNQRMVELWKLPPEIANNPDDRVQFDFAAQLTKDPAQFIATNRQIIASEETFAQDEVELKDGTVLERHSFRIQDGSGKSFGRVWTFRDVTNNKKLEAQYRQAQKMEAIGTLAGGIAHDFNNILSAIFGYAYLLEQDTDGNGGAQESVREILGAANRAKDLVQQILTFSRQREQKRQVCRLDVVVKEATKFLRASLPTLIKIDLDLAAQTPPVLADPTQIYQVVMNLATNALHAMEGSAGNLTVGLNAFTPDRQFLRLHQNLRPITYARLTVADTGHGMDSKTRERIFEPFFTTKPVGKGTGLGLAVVHGIVQGHEGFITVESEIGRGTVFNLYFPADASSAAPTSEAAPDVPMGHGERVLLLDDEPSLTTMFRHMLRRLNYQATVTNTAAEAIQWVRENPGQFDLVVTDYTMPEMNGLEVCRQLRSVRADLPVILASGYVASLTEELLNDAGVNQLLEKPVSLPTLANALSRALTNGEAGGG
jgi:PAS domain S-box-containing protein